MVGKGAHDKPDYHELIQGHYEHKKGDTQDHKSSRTVKDADPSEDERRRVGRDPGRRGLAREPQERPDAPGVPHRCRTLCAHVQHHLARRAARDRSPGRHGLGATHAGRGGEGGDHGAPAVGGALQFVHAPGEVRRGRAESGAGGRAARGEPPGRHDLGVLTKPSPADSRCAAGRDRARSP
jgi:hypothetical protein